MRSAGCRSALLSLLLLGCAPVVAVQRPVPAEIDLGPRVRTLSLLPVRGPPDAATRVTLTLQARAARQGTFRLGLWSAGMPADASGRTGYLGVEVAEWAQGEARTASGVEERARVRLSTRMGRTPDGPWSEPYETGASVIGLAGASEPTPQLLDEACLRAVDDLLRALAPQPAVEEVALDVGDARLRAGAALAERGALPEAKAALGAVHAQHPELPGAAYDLGLVTEALGDWEAAEALYAEAVRLEDRRLYRDALLSVRKRLASAQSGFPP